jgi:hypothetical protein
MPSQVLNTVNLRARRDPYQVHETDDLVERGNRIVGNRVVMVDCEHSPGARHGSENQSLGTPRLTTKATTWVWRRGSKPIRRT